MRPSIPDVIDRFQAYYDRNPGGGSLHIVLDDFNVKDTNVLFCLDYAEKHDDTEGVELATVLLRMSQTQRRKLAHMLSPSDEWNPLTGTGY